MHRTDRDDPVGWRRPQKPATLQPLGIERHANTVVPKNFLITDYPQLRSYGTNREHAAVSAGLKDGAQQGPISKGPQ
jgi:hypothetical protein